MSEDTREMILDDHIQELKLKHTIEIIKWYASINSKVDFVVL